MRELYSNARDLDARLQEEFPQLDGDRRWPASLMLPRSAGSILRLAVTLPDHQASRLVDELKGMVAAYMKALVRA